jgi:ABC-type branched-subunit amino acid transport system ATPase component/ABC-type branched-subunit amino acid transport system permease subunit
VNLSILFLGLVVGTTYGLLAVGLVIVYRVTKVINFAHGAIGALGAAVLGTLVVEAHVPYWIAFVGAIAASGLAGALAEAAVVRRLRNAPRVMSLVATLGLSAFFTGLAPAIYSGVNATLTYPSPPFFPEFDVGALRVTSAFSAQLFLSPILVIGFAGFLRYTRFGLALRATASNPTTARTLGIHAARMSMLSWVIASMFAAFTAILVFPTRGFSGGEPFGPALLLRALAAGVVARMTSLPVALGAGVVIGVVEQVLYDQVKTRGAPSLFVFLVLFVALLVQRRGDTRSREQESWASVATTAAVRLPAELARRLRVAGTGALVLLVVLLILLPTVISNADAEGVAAVLGLSVVALSVGVVTGLGGHLSLGQFAFAGIGAATCLQVGTGTDNWLLAFVCAGVAGGLAGVLVGIPALRIRGIMYAVTTLGFAYAAQGFLLRQSWLLGQQSSFERPTFFGQQLVRGKDFYLCALVVLGVAILLVWRVRRGGLARSLVALRDNEDAARAFTIPATVRTLQLFLIGGVLAGIGGAVWAHAVVLVTPASFTDQLSINVVAAAVLGGLAFLGGPLLGALYIFALPQFVHLDSAVLAGSALGWLLLILYAPAGLGSLLSRLRAAVLTRLVARAAREEVEDPTVGLSAHRVVLTSRRRVEGSGVPALQVEVLGLIGPNGAGKTTLFEVISGFTRPDAGRVLLHGRDVSSASAERRAGLGLVRSFQDSRLFPTLTVTEVLRLAQERAAPTSLVSSLVLGGAAERERAERADVLIELMGLAAYRDKRASELSTGTRRITELACVVALQPSVLLLDEPSSGIAQRESEALGLLLRKVRDHLDATLVVIEHDVPLVMSLCDRVAAMEAGELLLVGSPQEVATDPRVVESYLGGDARAIHRSRTAASV